MNPHNRNFDATKDMAEGEYQLLLSSKQLFVTTARFNCFDAERIIGPAPIDCPYALEERTYGGILIAEDILQAELIAKQRGYNEEIKGILEDIIPWEVVGMNNVFYS